jgi:hypothetical protein
VICYEPSSASECTQALGRGSRSLDSHADRIILCDNPIETRAEQYLKVLKKLDYERTMNTEVNMMVAKMLHGKEIEANAENQSKIQVIESSKQMIQGAKS